MVETSHTQLLDVMKHLVRDVGEAQVAMDESAERDLRLWNDFACGLLGSETAHPLLAEVCVNPLRLSEFRVTLDVALAQSTEREGKLGLKVYASPVHTFYQSRFGASRTATSSIELVCKAVLAEQADGDQVSSLPPSEKKEQAHG